MYYIFDGSYAGYLTGVFEYFERKEWQAFPVTSTDFHESLFGDFRSIGTDVVKAKRVNDGLIKRLGKERTGDFFRNFLSDDIAGWQIGYRLIRQVFAIGPDILKNFGDRDVLYFSQTLKKVNRERHRMKAFVRFSKSADGLYFAVVEPDFNVLPLIADFFKNRFTDQRWLIYDRKRDYGLLYDRQNVHEVKVCAEEGRQIQHPSVHIQLDERDELFKQLWKQYFKSTNIEARRNMKLHLQHVPRRYWKYLVEKSAG